MKTPRNQDLGLGNKLGKSGDRLIQQDGSFNIIRKGNKGWNAYQALVGMSNNAFILSSILFFIGINALFALLFLYVGVEQLNGVPRDGGKFEEFLYTFFLSVQTFTTVGYGVISPEGISANLIASLCALIGLVSFALVTGLFFARFSRPRSYITFSELAILTPYQDCMSLQCRIVNPRNHKIIDLHAQMTMTWIVEKNGKTQRRYEKLNLERDNAFLFPLNWTLVHPINKNSPLFNKTLQDIQAIHAEFLVIVSGHDESYNQKIHANSSYICNEIQEGVKFKMMYASENGKTTELYLDELSSVEEI
jgi:inward rectifier potassium channel